MKKYSFLLYFLLLFLNLSCAQENKTNINKKTIDYEVIVDNLSNPWGFTFLPDNSILITEKNGELIHFKDEEKTFIKNLPEITVLGQGGLMDIELHPDYNENGWIYISFVSSIGESRGANTAIMRFKIENNSAVNKELLYKATPNSRRGQHFGSRLAFDNNNYLYFSIGDRGNRDVNPQNIERDGGKIYRIHDNGEIPSNNPFTDNNKAKSAIFSYGHRNPQGMVLNPFTNEIWAHEHGPKGGDEINIIESGKNYGWPKISYGINYSGSKFTEHTSLPGMEQPLHHWTPSIAPSGMAFITSNIYPNWKGNLLVGSLKFRYLNRCVLENNKVIKEEKLLENLGRVRSIEQGPDGYIYVGIENVGIVKIYPKK